MAPGWVNELFDFPVSRYNYLSLIQMLLMRSGMGLSLGFSDVRQIDRLPLVLALELRELLSSSIQKIMDEQGDGDSGPPKGGGPSISAAKLLSGR